MPHGTIRLCQIAWVAAVLACGTEAGTPSVEITQPAEGATVGSSIPVTLAASGVEIGPAGEPGKAHHHLFIDRDVTPAAHPIPAGEGGIVHLGSGQSEFTIENLAPGQHILIAVLADADHIPIAPLATDTVRFTVAP
jgi:hypothetical protein